MLLTNFNEDEPLDGIAEKMIAALNEPIDVGGQMVSVGTSIGVAIYPTHAANEDELVKLADKAMYAAKSTGRNCYRFGQTAGAMK